MGEFRAGTWIIGLLFYFFLFFLIVFSTVNAQALISPGSDTITVNDPGFQAQSNAFLGIPGCTGKGNSMTAFGNIPCKRLDVGEDEDTCNSIRGCQWQNETLFFNITVFPAECEFSVNLTHFNLNGTSRSTYCDKLRNESICEMFKCIWSDQNTLAEEQFNIADTGKVITIWETVKFVAGFNINLGLGTFTFIFTFLFFYIPFVMLIWAIYMALPFFH